MTCSACGGTGHNRSSGNCPAKSVNADYIKRLINEEIEKSKTGNSDNPIYTEQLNRSIYRVTRHAYESRRQALVRNGHMDLSCDTDLMSQMGADISNLTSIKLDVQKFREWLGAFFEFPTKKGKGTGNNVTRNMLSCVYIISIYYRGESKPHRKFTIEFGSKTTVAIALTIRRSKAAFKGNSLDWVSLLSRESLIQLNTLKQQKHIGNWFITPRSADLILLPPSTENDRDRNGEGEKRKDGVKIRNPELDLFIKPERFSEFEKLRSPHAYVDQGGRVRTTTMDMLKK